MQTERRSRKSRPRRRHTRTYRSTVDKDAMQVWVNSFKGDHVDIDLLVENLISFMENLSLIFSLSADAGTTGEGVRLPPAMKGSSSPCILESLPAEMR